MKNLSPVLSQEIWLHPRYAIARFMNSKVAFKTLDNSKNTIMTAKIIQEKNLPKELHIHFRMDGKDYLNGHADILDIDLYVEKENLEQLALLIQEMKQADEPIEGNRQNEELLPTKIGLNRFAGKDDDY